MAQSAKAPKAAIVPIDASARLSARLVKNSVLKIYPGDSHSQWHDGTYRADSHLPEVTSARVALLFHRSGFTRVRPLLGGIDAWREGNHPMEVRTGLVANTL